MKASKVQDWFVEFSFEQVAKKDHMFKHIIKLIKLYGHFDFFFFLNKGKFVHKLLD